MSIDEFLNLNVDEILDEARYGKSLIIVEGENDYIYEYIADSIVKNHYKIVSIEDLIDKSGNKAVESFMLEVEKYAKEEELDYVPYILGIIDRDYREYENKLTQSKILYILEFDSIESYFINKEASKNMLLFSIKSERLVTNKLIDEIYSAIIDELLDELYTKSLEKLNKHLNLDGDLSFLEKKYNIYKSFETLLKITQGKELLNRFIDKNIKSHQKLCKKCRDGIIPPCNKKDKKEHKKFCLYSTTKYKIHHLRNSLFKNVNLDSLAPIKERIKKLK
jgi:hypothetical protein